jgi:uncharacterized protein YjbJ (UPF0337 family)
MSDSTHDKTEGRAKEMKGSVKEKAGEVFNKPEWENEGAADKAEGKVERKVGEVKKVFGQ